MSDFWEDLSMQLLEMSLNGDAMNKQILTQLFEARPEILREMDFG